MNQENKTTNLAFLESFTKGDSAKMKKYVSMYLGSATQVIVDMQDELDAQNWQNLRLKAHSIKPQVQFMGIDRLKEILVEIETTIIDEADKSSLPGLVKEATEINQLAVVELTQFIESE